MEVLPSVYSSVIPVGSHQPPRCYDRLVLLPIDCTLICLLFTLVCLYLRYLSVA